ncbi:non-hydrolyzing UDP-N-acetylglucosamine 2-epimerase [Roseicyclus amphidinii]|uniref:non-hydrolyzing UDP-N-acetylglucosamine 2-epimerase n=1 Tax=Roseicyclus amphidinii TaxID=3034232 RepID=UPI0024E0ABFC|nr:UDP-N-acetylglucosamine 2-epimerase (non-hydrolyzing) [Roseicyclus sp. Amp-Y-6]
MTLKAAIIAGTRPEAIKLIPVHAAFSMHPEITPTLIATGQHREMLKSVFMAFGVEPDLSLDVMLPNDRLSNLFGRIMHVLDAQFMEQKYDVVIVQGDTSTALAGALAAHYHRIPVAHIEAGLRTGDKWAPFPEESHRRMIGTLSDFHFAATQNAAMALLRENVTTNVVVVGNTVIDALLMMNKQIDLNQSKYQSEFPQLRNKARRHVLVTMHRRENFGQGIEDICAALRIISETYENCTITVSTHLNPAVREVVTERLGGVAHVHLMNPQSYDRMIYLMRNSWVILTDSGGLQEEAPSLNVPVLVMRDKTERQEGVAAGCARLVGTNKARILSDFQTLWSDPAAYQAMCDAANPYGDGTAARQIADHLVRFLLK